VLKNGVVLHKRGKKAEKKLTRTWRGHLSSRQGWTSAFPVLEITSNLLSIMGWGRYTVEASNFDAQMYGIKFRKGDENLRPFYKKNVIEWLLAFWIF
jgi:hypothetical protein